MANEKLIYASAARKAILKADPKLAYCIDSIPGVDAPTEVTETPPVAGCDVANKKQLIDVKPLMENGWHLVQTGKSNRFLCSMSLADVPTVDAVEVVYGKWITGRFDGEYTCSQCGFEYCEADPAEKPYKYCPECGSKNE
ncbi:MAG: hypothetical protein IJX37_07695 [Oscillospiraceae bacterium]|nr:hypothetical protein [Oscillospiraceae bacterium]